MDRVKWNDFMEILSDDLNRSGDYLIQGFQDMVADFISTGDVTVGLAVTAQAVPNMSVYVKEGRLYQKGQQGKLASDSSALTIAAAHSSYPRIDRVVAQYQAVEDLPETRNVMTDVVSRNISQQTVKTRIAGMVVFQVLQGVAAASPVPVSVPEGWVALAKINVPANATKIQQSNIVSEAPRLFNLLNHNHNGIGGGQKISYKNLTDTPAPATKADAEKGTDTSKMMTPVRVKEAIGKLAIPYLKDLTSVQSIIGSFWTDNLGVTQECLAELPLTTEIVSDFVFIQFGSSGGTEKQQFLYNGSWIYHRWSDDVLGSETWTKDSWKLLFNNNIVPITAGGTGADNAAQALKNLGGLAASGDTLNGTIKSTTNVPLCGASEQTGLQIQGGVDTNTSGQLILWGNQHPQYAGMAMLQACLEDGTKKSLTLAPSGGISWDSKTVVVVEEQQLGVNSGYVKYNNGWQIVWGHQKTLPNDDTVVTFAVPFAAVPIVLPAYVSIETGTTYKGIWQRGGATLTNFNVYTDHSVEGAISYIAIGRWK